MISIYSKSKAISQLTASKPRWSNLVFISLFNTSSSSNGHNLPSSSSATSRRRHDEESKRVRVSVWWDIENCSVPNGVNVFKITQSITSAVRINGINGPLQITAFGDVSCLSRPSQEALSSTGVSIVHIPRGKNNADRSLLLDLMYWVSQNPPPAHIFLISSDRDFAGILHKLRMNNYNILLAGMNDKNTPGVLCSAASIMWNWYELTQGKNLSGRRFNQPPDGPFNSWYGHFKGPLEDPFDASEPQIFSAADNSTNSELSDKRRPVPLSILRQIRRIISAYPNGMFISELRSELTKNKVPIDKSFFGHNKFSDFLQSMPHIVEIQDTYVNSQLYVRPASRKAVKRNDTSVESMSQKQNQDVEDTTSANGQTNTTIRMVDVEPQKATKETPDKNLIDAPRKENQVAFEKGLQGKESFNIGATNSGAFKEQHSNSDVGLFKRLWTNLFGPDTDAEKRINNITSELDDASVGNPEMSTPRETEIKSTNQYGVQHPSHSSSSNGSNDKVQQPVHPSCGDALSEDTKSNLSDDTEASPGFITRVISWCKSWRNSSVKTPTEQSTEEPSLIDGKSRKVDGASHSRKLDDASNSRKPELFSNDTFWSALHSFFKTRRGSDIVLNSTSREQFAEKLKKEGPLVLRPFQESNLLWLVDLLVSEKKWIEEFPEKIPRFRIAQPLVKSSVECQLPNSQLHSSTGLSSTFMSSSSEGNRVSSTFPKKPSEKFTNVVRNEVLADCQKLVDELMMQYPDGFNMGIIKKLFLNKYGYDLDLQKLGCSKLVSLLQNNLHGVKVESSYVYPDKMVSSTRFVSGATEKLSGSDSDVSDSPRRNEDDESPWEELGPVAKQEREPTIGRANGKYESFISDDDEFSELEEDDAASSFVQEEGQNKSRACEGESSLLQILDSWYSTKDESDPQDPGAEGLVDCSKQESGLSQPSNSGTEGAAASAANHARKQRPQKSYLFVSDPIETKKGKTIDGILSSLKKSGESRMRE